MIPLPAARDDTTTTTTSPARGTMRGWVATHPISAFLIILFSVAYPAMAVPILASHGIIPGGSLPAILHIAPDELAGLLLTLAGLLPAAVFVTWAADGRAGVAGYWAACCAGGSAWAGGSSCSPGYRC